MTRIATYALPAASTLEQAPALLGALDAALDQAGGGSLHIDASALTAYDSATIALLLHAQRGARARGAQLQVSGAPSKLLDLARLYGVDVLLPVAAPASA